MKPEARFIKSVHDVLSDDVYREKMFNPMRGGTPDCVYYGYKPVQDLWIEYKWVKKFGKFIKAVKLLSPLQTAWLMRAWDRLRDPWVVVGCPTGCVVLRGPAEWAVVARDGAQVLTKQDLARRIEDRCGLADSAEQHSEPSRSTP